jgi:uncharacterized protein YndB with AHSA1/START domain
MISTEINIIAPLSVVFDGWVNPSHIVNWYFASADWCCPRAELDCRVGGNFGIRMEAKDQSFGFDFNGTFTAVEEEKQLHYILEDGRHVELNLTPTAEGTHILWKFEPETQNPEALQQQGWQAILTNFKAYLEQTVVG